MVVKVAKGTALGFAAVQGTTIAGLFAYDAAKKRTRKRRSGFPQPGSFSSRVGSTDVTIYTYGATLFDDMIAAIESAESSVLLETFLWKNDEVGQRFKQALEDAAERGVDVRVIYDGFGNLVVNPQFYRLSPKVKVFRFPILRPRMFVNPMLSSGLTHRKILVVDDDTAFVGGYNIGSLYATQWRDTHVKLCGPEAWELRQSFVFLWNRLQKKYPEVPRIEAAGAWDSRVRSVDNLPARRVYPIRAMYLEAIDKADDHIYLTTAYFIPDQQILDALIRASKRGVDVQIMVPMESNHVLADFASRGYWRPLLDADVTVLLYEHAMIHAKTMTVDGRWATIGTANIDRLSLSFNYEVNAEIVDADVARAMEDVFRTDATNCHVLTREEWQSRHLIAQFAEAVIAPLAPFL